MMRTRDDSWIGPWVIEKLLEAKEVVKATELDSSLIDVERRQNPSFVVAAISVPCVDVMTVTDLIAKQPRPSFVLNLARESSVSPEALALSREAALPIGRMGDLKRALRLADVTTYREPEIEFAERGFEQHSNVQSFERLDERRYRVDRRSRPPITLVLLNEYEVTADSIRLARRRHGEFRWVVLTNPNARITGNAEEVAANLGCRLLTWRDFFKAASNDDS